MKHKQNVRALGATGLHAIIQGRSLNAQLPQLKAHCLPTEQGLLRDLISGSCRFYFRLNALAKILLKQPFSHEQQTLHALLIIGLYQLEYQHIADYAAINETVNACHALKQPQAKVVINACLRRFLREKSTLLTALDESPVTLYNHPKWLIKRLKKAWPDNWQDILIGNNQPPPLCLRINQQHSTRQDYMGQLAALDLEPIAAPFSPQGIYIKPCQVTHLPNFEQGQVSVQDEAAQLAANLLIPQKDERILDACAAPGGKTAHILELAQAQVSAVEIDSKRLVHIQQNLHRLGLQATVINGDASLPETWHKDNILYDKILLDVPCSATGVIRRNPDIKLLRRNEDIDALVALQATLLKQIWPLLKAGGKLLYATCSILPQENSQQVAHFLAHTKDARELKINANWGIAQPVGRQLFATHQQHDGFYYALLEKQLKCTQKD